MPKPFATGAAAARVLAAYCLAAGCTDHPLQAVPPAIESETVAAFPVEVRRKIDLIFVVDDSRSMREEQTSLTQNFPRFMRALERSGAADLHIGVISTDFGAGNITQDSCNGIGRGGRFRVRPNCGLDSDDAPFLRQGLAGEQNFDGTLGGAFACLATLGTEGCGFEHPLQSLRVALSNHNPDLPAFLRPDAHLGVIIISDEDDCSADPDATLFRAPRAGQSANLRCATTGHSCAGQPVTAAPLDLPLASCAPATQAVDDVGRKESLINVATFVDHVKAVKAPGRRILVAGIFGFSNDPATPYRITSVDGALDLAPICTTAAGNAAPALRLKAFVDAFGKDGTWHSICGADLSAAMDQIGAAVGRFEPDTCLDARPVDLDPATPALEADCAVFEDRTVNGARATALVPRCTAGATACWELADDATCSTGLRLITRRPPSTDEAVLRVHCNTRATL